MAQAEFLVDAAYGRNEHSSLVVYAVLVALAAMLSWLCATHAGMLPFWAPWDFSWVEFLGTWLAVWWYIRGLTLTLTQKDERPSWWRTVAFFAGILAIYGVLETRFEYLAEHMFFINRVQHVAMHHIGPMLIALAWPGATIVRGMPPALRAAVTHPLLARLVRIIQQPALAAVLFVGLIFFWLIPSVHFRAMIDPNLYAVMNWSMVVDGLLFWCLVLDPRPAPPARTSFGVRALLVIVIMFPQIVGGAMLVFNPHDLYRFYDLCGRIYPSIDAHYDQTIGGLVVWIPPAMMSVLGLVLVLNTLRRAEQKAAKDVGQMAGPYVDASAWTGM